MPSLVRKSESTESKASRPPGATRTASAGNRALRKRKSPVDKPSKIFVLDTNVLLHDPYSLMKLGENDVFIPFVTIEELDGKKSGATDIARNARQATRLIDDVISQPGYTMVTGFPLAGFGKESSGKLFVQRETLPFLPGEVVHKNDNLYLSVLNFLSRSHPGRPVIMITKDLNLRIKARALGFVAEDYRHDHALEDSDLVDKGIHPVSADEMAQWLGASSAIAPEKSSPYRFFRGPKLNHPVNRFLLDPSGALFRVVEQADDSTLLSSVLDHSKAKNTVLGISSRNEEQGAALDLLIDPEVDLVALLGPAGTGKTLLALAAAFRQIGEGLYDGIIFTRANTPLGEDIGFLPGNEQEKMAPWLGALYDNIEVLAEAQGGLTQAQKFRDQANEAVTVCAVTFLRGRTFQRKIIILDEAQNLTPKQMKALITRAAEGTKVVVLGNLAQIDSPYLSETSSGLAFLVERFKGWPHFGSLVLEKGERSRLANAANERL